MNRRDFVKKTLLSSVAVSANSAFGFAANNQPSVKNRKISIMWGVLDVGDTIMEKFQLCRQAGFDGVQISSHMDRDKVLKARDATGLEISGIVGSGSFSSPDPKEREKGREALKVSLEDAKAYGCDTVLCTVGEVNASISYDECWYRSIEEIKKVIPLAEKLDVTIAIENVWNNFLLSPIEARYYLDQFSSPYVKFYFDCGNVLIYGWPEQWINILGRHIARVHLKEFSREKANNEGKWAGFDVNLREGDVNWSAVMKALDNIGYRDWVTLEQVGPDRADSLENMNRLVTKTKKILSS